MPPAEEGGAPRRYCCGEHRVEARKRRYEARRAAAPAPARAPTAAARTTTAPPGGPLRRHTVTRNALAMAALGALIAVTVPGGEFRTDPAGRAAPRATGDTPPVKVDLAWVPKAKRMLRGVDENLSKIGAAEKAFASTVPKARTAEMHGWMAQLAVRKAQLNRIKGVLEKGLRAVREYERSRKELDGIRHKLVLVQRARNSLRELSAESRTATGVRMDVLDGQVANLERQSRSVDTQVRTWGEETRRAGREPRTEPSPGTDNLVDNVLRTARPDGERGTGEHGKGKRDKGRGKDKRDHRRTAPPPSDRTARPPEEPDKGERRTEAPPNPGHERHKKKPRKTTKRYVIVIPATSEHPRITITTTDRDKAIYLYELARAAQRHERSQETATT